MKPPRRLAGARRLALLGIAVSLAGVAAGSTGAAFTASQSTPGNSFSAAPDWTAPTAGPATIQKTEGGVENHVKQGGTYHVYAQVTDNGNPPAGVAPAGVTADVSSITAGQTAVPLVTTGGPWTVNGTSYNRRTATALTAANPLSEGTESWTVTSSDTSSPVNTGNSDPFSVDVDNTPPSAADVQTVNTSDGTQGRPEAGDRIELTYSERLEPDSVLAGWDGTATNVVVRINNAFWDQVLVYDAANSSQLPVTGGAGIYLGRSDYLTANRTFGASGTPSTMAQSGAVITITLGTASGAVTTAAANGTMYWTPSGTPYDRAANAGSTTLRTELGAADKDF